MTVLEAIQKSTEFLQKKGIDSPRLQSELLLAHILRMQRLKLYLDFSRALSDSEVAVLRDLVQRRARREPLQHIVGSTSFCGLEIAVDRNVLVPRPETELLAEEGWTFLKALERESTFLDFGTGSGCIAIALCQFAPSARGWAIDQSAEALEVAQKNADANNVASRITLLQSDGFTGIDPSTRFDLILSNPPYIPAAEIQTLQEEVRDFDPHLALDGGEDGLDFYRLLARGGKQFLAPGGKLMVEFGDGQEQNLPGLFQAEGWTAIRIREDYTARPRILIAE